MSESPDLNVDQVIASAAKFLVEGGETDAAIVLLSATAEPFTYEWDEWDGWWKVTAFFRGPRMLHDLLKDTNHPVHKAIEHAINVVLPIDYGLQRIVPLVDMVELWPGWREEMLDIARGKVITNQGITREGETFLLWKNLRFRSPPEVAIATALEKRHVLFLPNCMGRLTRLDGIRTNNAADFLVCHQGYWGIIEVDGDLYHPPERIAEEQLRDRHFRQYGIRPVEHYKASRCAAEPDAVVEEFLRQLEREHSI